MRNRIDYEPKIHKESLVGLSDELITDLEKDFLVELHDAIEALLITETKVTLPNINAMISTKLSNDELYDYIKEINMLEASITERINEI